MTSSQAQLHPLFDNIVRGSLEGVADGWADDIEVWHVGDPAPLRRAEALHVVKMLIDYTTDRYYSDVRRHELPGGFVQQHILGGTTVEGRSFAAHVCIVCLHDNEGLTRRIDEYFDPREFAPLLELF